MNIKEFDIEGRKIGINVPPLVVAEIGINHNGSIDVAKRMVDAAVESGAELIKHQTHVVEDEMSSEAKKIIPGNSTDSIYKIINDCALSEDEELELKNYTESKGVIFISTPFSRAALNRLEDFGVKAYKIGSGECNNYPLLELVASKKKPVILSTGMNGFETIDKAVNIFNKYEIPFALMHTTNLYPTPHNLVRLNAVKELLDRYNVPVGLSDHTLDNNACLGAVALGASILERHFTDSMDREGPDIVCSMDPESLKDLIKNSRILFECRGGNKQPLSEEQVTMDFAFASVCTLREIKAGEVLNVDNIWVRRPGKGDFNAEEYADLLGKTVTQDIPKDVQLKKEHISL